MRAGTAAACGPSVSRSPAQEPAASSTASPTRAGRPGLTPLSAGNVVPARVGCLVAGMIGVDSTDELASPDPVTVVPAAHAATRQAAARATASTGTGRIAAKGRKIAPTVNLKIKLATRINPDGRDNRMRRCAPLAIVEYVRAYGGPG